VPERMKYTLLSAVAGSISCLIVPNGGSDGIHLVLEKETPHQKRRALQGNCQGEDEFYSGGIWRWLSGHNEPFCCEDGQMLTAREFNMPIERKDLPHIRELLNKKPKRRSKYNNQKVKVDGINFDSKKEARYYRELKFRVKMGEVSYFLLQVPIRLPGGIVYKVDFIEFWVDGSVHYIDVKGKRTRVYINKKKTVEAVYPIRIEEK